jgi:hypothetical protein
MLMSSSISVNKTIRDVQESARHRWQTASTLCPS